MGQVLKVVPGCGYDPLAAARARRSPQPGRGATGSTNMTPAYQLTAQTGLVDSAQFYRGLSAAASNVLRLNTSAGVAVRALVYCTRF